MIGIVCIAHGDTGLHIASTLTRVRAADHQDVEGAPVLVGIQSQAHILGEQLVLLLGEYGVD